MIAYSDRVHFDVVALTLEEIQLSDLPPAPGNAEYWARVRFGNTWHYPVAICGPRDTHSTAWKMCEFLMRNVQFWWKDRFPTDAPEALFTGRLPKGVEFVFKVCSEGLVTVPMPLQLVPSTGSYTSKSASLMQQHNRAVPTVDCRWNISNPMQSPARDRLHDCGAYLQDLEALFEQHQLASNPDKWPCWLMATYLEMDNPKDMNQSFDEATGEPASARPNGECDTITTFTNRASPTSKTLSVCVPRRGRAAVEVSWDPRTEITLIGQTTMAYLYPCPLVYITRQASNLYEIDLTRGTLMQWRSTGLVPTHIERCHQLCKMVEDRHDLDEEPVFEMTIPTSAVREQRQSLRLREPGNPTRTFFGSPLNDDSFHEQSDNGPPLALPSRSYDDW